LQGARAYTLADVATDPGADPSDRDVLAEQRAYYRQRAPEYDEWWQRVGRYGLDESQAEDWALQVRQVESALAASGPTGDVLELAGGTGWWTERLVSTASTLTVVDASPETLEINRRRVGSDTPVTYVVADLFSWRPQRRYSFVFFSFWLSHVPRARFGQFWELVERCLEPGGHAFLVDSRRTSSYPAVDTRRKLEEVELRRLNDGSEHRLIKVYYEPSELMTLLRSRGWDAHIRGTTWFIYGSVRPEANDLGTVDWGDSTDRSGPPTEAGTGSNRN
jgi:demethylmenaquinone methyltransferase/2-methoxy-6-polyprenyl-1,4-benzoquinol methylase